MKIKISFSWTENISSGLCFIIIILLGLMVAWLAIDAGQKIIDNPPPAIVRGLEK